MAQSPVEFAAAFERLRLHMSANVSDDDALAQLVAFWPKLLTVHKNPAYASYLAEFVFFLESRLKTEGIRDLTIEELEQLESLCLAINVSAESINKVRRQIARLLFYVGKHKDALRVILRSCNEQCELDFELTLDTSLNEFEQFRVVVDSLGDRTSKTKEILQQFLDDWQGEREFVSTSQVYSLFVQNGDTGSRTRGKLRALIGSVEARGRNSTSDEVTFDNQLRAADDPIVGVAYQALAAVRQYFKAIGNPRLGSPYYHAHFSVAEKNATYTGDSIGIAAALLTYAQLLHTEALRHDHLLSGDVACTGRIDESGQITAVNAESLPAKLERAFFSHIKYLILPTANAAQAREFLDSLQKSYPARQLLLLPVVSLSAMVNDHNIIRPEKVCIGEFVAKKAVKYSRMTKVQVPMLMILAYLLLCVIYPKAWVWFDWKIDHLELQSHSFKAVNERGRTIWQSHDYPFKLAKEVYGRDSSRVARAYYACDTDSDGRDELAFVPMSSERQSASKPFLELYDDDGSLLWSRPTLIRTTYPGDSGPDLSLDYGPFGFIPMVDAQRGISFLSFTGASNPYRLQISHFVSDGSIASGPYIHTGQFSSASEVTDVDGDGSPEVVLGGTNNRYSRACLLIIKTSELCGVSPPYDNDLFVRSGMQRGMQFRYVAFPKTRLSMAEGVKNWVVRFTIDKVYGSGFRIGVKEGDGLTTCGKTYSYNTDDGALPGIEYWLDSNLVPYRVTFGDHDFALMNAYLVDMGLAPYESRDSLTEMLKQDVTVYYKDSVVHHLSANVDFYRR